MGFLPTVLLQWSSELNSAIDISFSSLIRKMSVFTLGHLLFDHFQFTLIHGPNIPVSYAVLFFLQHQTLLSPPDTSTTESCFSLWHSCFILSRAIYFSSPVAYWTPSDIMGLIFQYHIILPFHTIRGILLARILE